MNKSRLSIIDKKSLEIGDIWKGNLISELVYSFDVDKYVAEISNNRGWKILNSSLSGSGSS